MNSSQVVLITGSSTGFGGTCSRRPWRVKGILFSLRWSIPMVGMPRMPPKYARLRKRSHCQIHVLELDVTDDASVGRAMDAAPVAKAGRIDVAINNAGYYLGGLAEAVTTEQAQRQMDTNFLGPVRVKSRGASVHAAPTQRPAHAHQQRSRPCGYRPRVSIALVNLRSRRWPSRSSYELAAQGIESVIVEPGAYETAVFGNSVTAADLARTDTYGAAKEFPAKLNAGLLAVAGNAQEVADAVLRILETPAGEKHLRYRISAASLGVDEINALSRKVQASLLEAFGIAADTKFLGGKAVASGLALPCTNSFF